MRSFVAHLCQPLWVCWASLVCVLGRTCVGHSMCSLSSTTTLCTGNAVWRAGHHSLVSWAQLLPVAAPFARRVLCVVGRCTLCAPGFGLLVWASVLLLLHLLLLLFVLPSVPGLSSGCVCAVCCARVERPFFDHASCVCCAQCRSPVNACFVSCHFLRVACVLRPSRTGHGVSAQTRMFVLTLC